ncbi:E3 ubiquitin-protein ligase Hakai-like [Pyrus ussuriensis x Pyrus communis]|uniref:E3 ubiquitin-protein ligase Hakai-like n=1 Tax=Pyrus ussuriensis x Pyrus communis TaxID=2448454 RepID=A0A5N5F985_9ROSA|nr:E3 ubiquitin-protein ligase Hakai-like [Pyrus ussuriensis x Pyrus communis]
MLQMRLKIFTPLEGAARAKQLPAKILTGISAATTTTLVKIVVVAHVASLENGSTWWSCGGWEGPQ